MEITIKFNIDNSVDPSRPTLNTSVGIKTTPTTENYVHSTSEVLAATYYTAISGPIALKRFIQLVQSIT